MSVTSINFIIYEENVYTSVYTSEPNEYKKIVIELQIYSKFSHKKNCNYIFVQNFGFSKNIYLQKNLCIFIVFK